MTSAGPESWHPDPEFYYRPGGGPLLDMGPYYLSALVHLLGPVVRVTGAASRPRAEREIGSGPRAGTRFPVEVDTHVTGVLEHAGGALSTLVMSFDVHAATAAAHRGPRHRGLALGARPERVRRDWSNCARGERRVDSRSRLGRIPDGRARYGLARPRPKRSPPDVRTGPRPNSPTTYSM